MLRDFCHHQACLARAPEGNTKYGKEKLIPATTKTHQNANQNYNEIPSHASLKSQETIDAGKPVKK